MKTTHLIQNPAGTYTMVGSVPHALCSEVDAKTNDVMGGRSHRREDGSLATYKPFRFATVADFLDAWNSKMDDADFALCASPDCACRKLF